jgi:hypothetical protein
VGLYKALGEGGSRSTQWQWLSIEIGVSDVGPFLIFAALNLGEP